MSATSDGTTASGGQVPETWGELLAWVFGDKSDRAHVCGFRGDPSNPPKSVWQGGWFKTEAPALRPEVNCYLTLSLFTGYRRVQDPAQFDGLYGFLVDDVGTKNDPDTVLAGLGEPSWRLETSPGNRQWVYALAAPVVALGPAQRFLAAVRRLLGDREGKDDINRYARLPWSTNTKAALGPGGFAIQGFATWSGRRLDLAGLADRLGLPFDWDKDTDQDKAAMSGATVSQLVNRQQLHDQLHEQDAILRAMRMLGLVQGQARKSPMGFGYDVTCPWVGEHSSRADSGTFYVPVNAKGNRAFECQHSHCSGRRAEDLHARLNDMLAEDSGGMVTLVSLDFDVVEPSTVGLPDVIAAMHREGYEISEDGLAEFCIDQMRGAWLYDRKRKCWLRCAKGLWRDDGDSAAFTWVRKLKTRFRKSHGAAAKMLAKVNAAKWVETAARHELSAATGDWDKDINLAGVPEGCVVDLRTSEMRAAHAKDMISKRFAVAPVEMPTPIWDKFQWEATGGDINLIEFLIRWYGYCLSGDVSLEKFLFMHGPGGSGKSTLRHTIAAIMGDYALYAPMTMFMQRKNPEHPTEIARLQGARLVTASETNEGHQFDLHRLFEFTGNEGKLTGRPMRGDYTEFAPTFKLLFTGNVLPKLSRVDNSIRRRAMVVRFDHVPPVPDDTLKLRLVPEYPGILWKLVRGCAEVLSDLNGFDASIPMSVRQATEDWFGDEDVVVAWLNACCAPAPGDEVAFKDAYASHEKWCLDEERSPCAPRSFTQAVIAARVFACGKRHAMGGPAITGMRLR